MGDRNIESQLDALCPLTDCHAVSERFANAVDTWLATYDAGLADLVARHEQHKAELAAFAERMSKP